MCPLKHSCRSPNLQCDRIWKQSFLKVIRLNETIRVRSSSDRIGVLIRRARERTLFFLMYTQSGKARGAYSQKAALCKPGRELSPAPNHAGNLISDFLPPELGENTFLLFKSPSLRYLLWQPELTNTLTYKRG